MMCDLLEIPRLKNDIPNGMVVAMSYIGTLISNMTKKAPQIEYEMIKFMQDDLVIDGSKAEQELGIHYTPIRTALEEIAAEMRKEQVIKA